MSALLLCPLTSGLVFLPLSAEALALPVPCFPSFPGLPIRCIRTTGQPEHIDPDWQAVARGGAVGVAPLGAAALVSAVVVAPLDEVGFHGSLLPNGPVNRN